MGLISDEEARGSSSDAEETLPLYEETPRLDGSELQPPEPKATPDEVRDFIVQVMLARGVGEDHARRVAARWTLGTGRELRNYPVAMFRDIFGSEVEDGWAVYKGVRTLYYQKENENKKANKLGLCVCLLFSIGLAVGGGFLMGSDMDSAARVFPGFLMIAAGVAGTVIFLICLAPNTDPEQKAEQELHSGWYKTPAPLAGPS